jgi:hypothetical protein
MIEVPRYLKNHEAVISAFGRWPSFHDAPVKTFEQLPNRITLTLHAWEMTSEINEKGYFVLRNHHLVRFQFGDIVEADLSSFISANILYELGLSSVAEVEAIGKFKVTLESAMGGELCGSLTAIRGEVIAVQPCDEKGNVI